MPRLLAVLVLGFLAADATGSVPTVIGESLTGRPITARLVALDGPVAPADRPRLLVVAGLHADHEVGIGVARRLPDRLLARAADDPGLAELLARFAVEVVSLANPDARAALDAGPARELRTNVRPVDSDRDGRVDEDGPDDLDGDGRIATMRVPDPAGEWRESDDDADRLVKADPAKGERGRWRLLPEALDDDGDGEYAEDPFGGVDLDRNFPHGWKEHDPATGTSCPSEPESRALAEHLLANPGIASVLVYGRRDNLAKTPEADSAKGRVAPRGPLPDDRFLFAEVSRRFAEIAKPPGGEADPADGGFHQWVYAQRGIPALSTKLLYEPVAEPLPWKPFDHPALGPVEIGGPVPALDFVVPDGRLDELADEQVRFVAEILALQPAPRIEAAKARARPGGVFEITATLVNDGFFPVVTAMGERTRAVLPVRVTIDRDAGRILAGRPRMLVPRLGGRGASKELRWLVRAEPGEVVRIRAVTPYSGTVEATVGMEAR